MKLFDMSSSWEGAQKFASTMMISNVILSVLLACSVFVNLSTHETTRLVPPYLDKVVTVGWNTADQSYLEGIGLYVADLVGNVTPRNADFVADRLSQILTPRIYKQAREQILTLANDPVFKSNGGSIRFDPTKIESEKETQKVFIIGQMVSSQIGSRTSRSVVIEMKIFMRDGRPWVDSLDHYDGTVPRTQDWLDSHPTQVLTIEKQQQAAADAAEDAAASAAATRGAAPAPLAAPSQAQLDSLQQPAPQVNAPTVDPATQTAPAAAPTAAPVAPGALPSRLPQAANTGVTAPEPVSADAPVRPMANLQSRASMFANGNTTLSQHAPEKTQ
ncbi:TPA: TraE/TraK family type IV conjugative transfer system protein [Burkholderia lata]